MDECENKCPKPGNPKAPLVSQCSHFSAVEVNYDIKGPGRYGSPKYFCSASCLFRALYRMGVIKDSEYYAGRERPNRPAPKPEFELELEEAV